MEHRKTFASVLTLVILLAFLTVRYLFFRGPAFNVSAVETTEDIKIYWDENCTFKVSSIDWSVLSPGDTKKVVVYVRNEGNETFLLVLWTANWNPAKASQYLMFSWSCENNMVKAGKITKVTQSLAVSPDTIGISSFSFDIIFEARKHFLGDINKDYAVDGSDLALLCLAFGSTPESPLWNPDADLNKDVHIDGLDLTLLVVDFGKTWEP